MSRRKDFHLHRKQVFSVSVLFTFPINQGFPGEENFRSCLLGLSNDPHLQTQINTYALVFGNSNIGFNFYNEAKKIAVSAILWKCMDSGCLADDMDGQVAKKVI